MIKCILKYSNIVILRNVNYLSISNLYLSQNQIIGNTDGVDWALIESNVFHFTNFTFERNFINDEIFIKHNNPTLSLEQWFPYNYIINFLAYNNSIFGALNN